jgi:hypothetical protein
VDADRATRMTAALRERRVMAHVVEAGVDEFGIRVVLDEGIEALWDVDGAAGPALGSRSRSSGTEC